MPKKSKIRSTFLSGRSLLIGLLVVGLFSGVVGLRQAHADKFDDQINALRAQNAKTQGVLNGLSAQATSYQDVIHRYQVQINNIEGQIAANEKQQAILQSKITDAQEKINEQKKYLGEDIRAMYVDGQLSTIEELATSKSLSDYVDKEVYRVTVQNKINDLIKKIADLQEKLQRQKTQLDELVDSERKQNYQLSSAQDEQQRLLAYNQGQQAAYNQQISSNTGKIAELRRQQAIINSRYNIGNFKGDPGNGGYPSVWAYAPQDSMIDSWGMYNRECVSYTAFKVHQDFLSGRNSRDMPWWGGRGNANQWDDNARAAGIRVDTNPSAGSIAISNAGFYGHAMYVAAVNGNQIYVQQYNAGLNGQYSEGWRYTTGLVFLHF